jgi:hypothetical protein
MLGQVTGLGLRELSVDVLEEPVDGVLAGEHGKAAT